MEENQTVKLVFDHINMNYDYLFGSDCFAWGGNDGAVVSVYDGSNTTDADLLGRYNLY